MKKLKLLALPLVFIATAGFISCSSSDNNGNGSGSSSTYTTDDLIGKWTSDNPDKGFSENIFTFLNATQVTVYDGSTTETLNYTLSGSSITIDGQPDYVKSMTLTSKTQFTMKVYNEDWGGWWTGTYTKQSSSSSSSGSSDSGSQSTTTELSGTTWIYNSGLVSTLKFSSGSKFTLTESMESYYSETEFSGTYTVNGSNVVFTPTSGSMLEKGGNWTGTGVISGSQMEVDFTNGSYSTNSGTYTKQ